MSISTARRNCIIAAIAQENGIHLSTDSFRVHVTFPAIHRTISPVFYKSVLRYFTRSTPVTRPERIRRKPAERNARVYFLLACNRVKIGFASDLQKRIRSIKTGCPEPPVLLADIDGSREIEQHLHRRFVALRVHGEWFRAEEPLLSFIDEMKRRHAVES